LPPTWSVLGEYRFDSSVKNAGKKMVGDYAGIGLRMPGVRRSAWRPALSRQHAFEDHSGQVTAGIGGTIAPSLILSIGVPVIYGNPGSYYRAALEEEVNEDVEDRDDNAITVDNVVSILLAVGLSFSFWCFGPLPAVRSASGARRNHAPVEFCVPRLPFYPVTP